MQNQEKNLVTPLLCTLDAWGKELSYQKTEKTAKVYLLDVKQFLNWLMQKGLSSIKKVKPETVKEYLSYKINELKSSGASANRYLCSIKCFCRYLMEADIIVSDFCEGIKPPRYNVKIPIVPVKSEMDLLLEQPWQGDPCYLRDKAILELMYSSGLRVSEVCKLKIQDYLGNSVRILDSKRGKSRTIPITESARHWIDRYLEEWRGDEVETPYVFIMLTGSVISAQIIRKIVQRMARLAGMGHTTPHTIRHACATHLLDNGADIRFIQAILGHSSIKTTQIYTHLSAANLQDGFTRFHNRPAPTN